MVFATTVRTVSLQSAKLQAARIPSIKFRKGGLAAGAHGSAGSSAAPQVKKGKGVQQAKGGPAPAMIILQELPARFHRKPLSKEEIDYINGGGVA